MDDEPVWSQWARNFLHMVVNGRSEMGKSRGMAVWLPHNMVAEFQGRK